MKKLILAGLVASATAITALPTYAQTDNDAVVQEVSVNNIIDIIFVGTPVTKKLNLDGTLASLSMPMILILKSSWPAG